MELNAVAIIKSQNAFVSSLKKNSEQENADSNMPAPATVFKAGQTAHTTLQDLNESPSIDKFLKSAAICAEENVSKTRITVAYWFIIVCYTTTVFHTCNEILLLTHNAS